jgi:pyruvate,water dikinase
MNVSAHQGKLEGPRPRATATTIGLDRLGRQDAPRVGAKAANLGELVRAGFDVPEGFVATGEADEDDVVRAAAYLGDGPLAVRSSIAAEDLPGASFAGQYESLLDVRGAEALVAGVRHVRASVATERVRRYQDDVAGGDIGAVGVVVQRQVAAHAAGVAFTANPVTGADEVVVSAVRGLGERLVSGDADPDEWVVRGDDVTCLRAPEDSLREDQVLEVVAAARRAAAHFGFPVDVEWAFERDRLWLLQARPITALPTVVEPIAVLVEVPEGFWERDDHFPQPITPMTRMMLNVSTRALAGAFAEFGLPMDGLEWREIGGWAYLRVVPLGGKQPPRPPSWLVRPVNALMSKVHPLLHQRVARIAEVERTDAMIGLVDRWWDQDRAVFAATVRRLQDVALPALSDDDLGRHFDETMRFATDAMTLHHRLHLADVVFPVRLAQFCRDHLGWPEQTVLGMLAGLSEASTDPGRALAALAALARTRPRVRDLLSQPDDRAVARLEEVDGELAEAFHAYLYEFGCRALRYDVAEPSLAEVPAVALGLVRDQLVRGYDAAERATAQREKRDAIVARARAELAGEPADVRDRFEWLLDRAERAYPVREDNEFYLVSAPLALIRYAALEVGRRLHHRGQLDRSEHVFFLEAEEATGLLAGGGDLREVVRGREGEAAWARSHPGPATYGPQPASPVLAGLPPLVQEFVRVILRSVELVFEAGLSGREQDAVEGVVGGVAASPGTYTGPVRVIRNEGEFGKIRAGDVLVCPITSPVWSVLFASVGALVTDTGGILSHSAIIAREYHIPAVVATGNATTLLRDGQIVAVDGSAGAVRIDQATGSAS